MAFIVASAYIQVQYVYYGYNHYVAELLGLSGPFWGRQYFFWHDGMPLTLIYEVFSPRINSYLSGSGIP